MPRPPLEQAKTRGRQTQQLSSLCEASVGAAELCWQGWPPPTYPRSSTRLHPVGPPKVGPRRGAAPPPADTRRAHTKGSLINPGHVIQLCHPPLADKAFAPRVPSRVLHSTAHAVHKKETREYSTTPARELLRRTCHTPPPALEAPKFRPHRTFDTPAAWSSRPPLFRPLPLRPGKGMGPCAWLPGHMSRGSRQPSSSGTAPRPRRGAAQA